MDFKVDTSVDSGDSVLKNLARGHLEGLSDESDAAVVAAAQPTTEAPGRYEPVDQPDAPQGAAKAIELPGAQVILPPRCAPRLEIHRKARKRRKPTQPTPTAVTPASYVVAQVVLAVLGATLIGLTAYWLMV